MKNSKPSSPSLKNDIVQHVDLYGVTTANVVSRVFCRRRRRAAARALEELRKEERLFRHGLLYTLTRRRPGRQLLSAQFAALAFCCMGNNLRPMLSREQVGKLTGRVARLTGVEPPRNARCYLHQKRRVGLIRVQPPSRSTEAGDLNRMLGRLQSDVNDDAFRTWAYFASNDELTLVYLMHTKVKIAELSRWLAWRPLVSRAVSPAVVIPVEVRAARPLPESKKS